MIKNIVFGVALAIVLSLFLIPAIAKPSNAKTIPTGNVVSGEYQEVVLTFENYEYKLTPEVLIKDVAVKMTVDLDTVYGCMRDIVIPAFGVKKYVKEGDNVIEFMPDKAGKFNIACSMNMGRGTFEVTEGDGSKSTFVESELTIASSCTQESCGCN